MMEEQSFLYHATILQYEEREKMDPLVRQVNEAVQIVISKAECIRIRMG